MLNAKFFPALMAAVLFAATAWGAAKYGDATIESGKMTVLREGKRLVFRTSDQRVEINEEDVLRVGRESKVVLNTREPATITLGSNSVLHVKPWQKRKKRGFLRMLFGRVRASVTTIVGKERLNVRTATATIGVKGTDFTTSVTAQANTSVNVAEGVVGLEGPDGIEVSIPIGQISVVVGLRTTPPAPTPPEVEAAPLDAPDPTTPEALELPAQEAIIEAGIFTQEEAEQSSETPVAPPEEPEEAEEAAPAEEASATEAAETAGEAAETAAASATGEVSFEKNVIVEFER